MNHTDTLQKLVSLLGRSTNDPEVIEMFTQLGVKFPLKRPKRSEDGYLIELNDPKLHLDVKLQEALPMLENRDKLNEKELVFSGISHIQRTTATEPIIFPFGVSFGISLDRAKEILGDYFDERKFLRKFFWLKDNIVILLSFDEWGLVNEIAYRLIFDFDLKKLDIKL